ncbi:unnamed protein product [Brassica napus]|uniref:(rape) hypothetical protein n=1 Tax=Brassica napus TaxID=3708 RepID=A0A817AU63_BRANA|nr:unnamed protein product [Brassica napus]
MRTNTCFYCQNSKVAIDYFNWICPLIQRIIHTNVQASLHEIPKQALPYPSRECLQIDSQNQQVLEQQLDFGALGQPLSLGEDQFPPSDHSLYPPHPPHFPTCVLPAGVAFHSSGFVSSDPIAFRDRVCEDVTEAYRLPPNTYADKCICIVSHAPNFRALWDSLEVIFGLYFSSEGSCPTGETTFAATAELPLLSGNVLSASSKGCGDLADERMVAQITVAKHRKPNHAPFDLTKKKVMNVILDPIEDSTESQAEKTYSLLGMCRETLAVSFQWCTYITLSLLIFTAAFDGLQSSFAGQKSVSLLTSCFF